MKLVAFLLAMAVGAALAEAMVRIARPGYPGFRLPQVNHRPTPGLGFEIIPSQLAYTWASPARINSLGYRGPEPRSPPGRPLVLCVGDSMTFGNNVSEDETYPVQLQDLMQREWPQTQPEVFNMGVQRYYTYQEVEVVRRQAPRLRPDAISLAVYLNDLGERPGADFEAEYEGEREQAASAFHNAFPALYLLVKNSAAIALMRGAYLTAMNPRSSIGVRALEGKVSAADEAKWRTVEEDLVTFRELADTYGFQPYVVFVPARPQVRRDMPQSAYPGRLVEYATRQGLVAINPIDEFKRELSAGRDPYLPWDNHMSQTGHRIVAEAIMRQLRQHGWRSRRHTDTADNVTGARTP
jgi:lysophospholipase L1-like esterase